MIASYGLKFIFLGLALTAISSLVAAYLDSHLLFIVAAVLAVMTVFLTFFYRNPHRTIPGEDSLILSVADGRVLDVEDIENDYIGGKGKRVSIFLSIFDVHVNRMPTTGKIDYVEYVPGKFHKAFVDKASRENEHTEIGLSFEAGKLILKQIAGILARRIEYTSRIDQRVHAGEIFGMIHFGSRAELFLPENVEVLVKKNDRVFAGETVIGRIK